MLISLLASVLPAAILATLIVGVGWLVHWVCTGACTKGADGE